MTHPVRSLPGHLATVLAVISTTVMTYAGAASLYYESWGQPVPVLLESLLPALALLLLCLAALRWPGAGGWLLLGVGVAVAAWWLNGQRGRGVATYQVVVTALILFGPLLLAAGLFLLEARHRRLLREEGVERPRRWIARNYRYVLLVGAPLVALALVSAAWLPRLLSRLDDGSRGSRIVEGNGVTLAWAPQGPGWNWKQSDGLYPSWNMLATFGAPPVGLEGKSRPGMPDAGAAEMERFGLCAYLDEHGAALLDEPLHLWRLPTADEIAQSLTRDGDNAGCARDGGSPHATCRRPPDKETPLWAPDEAPIYYLAAGEFDAEGADCVNYTGGFNRQPKSARTRGVGYRCVKDVRASP